MNKIRWVDARRPLRSLGMKLFILYYVSLLCIMVLIGTFSYHFFKSIVQNKVIEAAQETIIQAGEKLDILFGTYENLSLQIELDNDIQYYFSQMSSLPIGSSQYYDVVRKLSDRIGVYINSNTSIRAIHMFTEYGAELNLTGSMITRENVSEEAWFKQIQSERGKAVWLETKKNGYSEGAATFGVGSVLKDRDKHNEIAVLFIEINASIFSDQLDQIRIGKSGSVYLVNKDNRYVYMKNINEFGQTAPNRISPKVLAAKYGTFESEDGKLQVVVYKSHSIGWYSSGTGWYVVGIVPVNELTEEARKIYSVFVIGGIICVAIAILISVFLSVTISRPIKRLQRSMKEVERGNFDIQVKIKGSLHSSNEIDMLGRAFNKMTGEIKGLIEQNNHVQALKRKSELQALQGQINPHFLYNTLDSIVWMAERNKVEEVVEMTISLANLYRASISKGEEVISIREELEHVRFYLKIQKIRYRNTLDFEIDVEDGIMDYLILKVLLQPIVENAIYHGIKYKSDSGLIKITGRSEGNTIFLQVADNGIGMSPKQLKDIMKEREISSKGSGIGLKNVDERIKLYFGDNYGLSFESEFDSGTTVTIKLPLLEAKSV